MSYLPRMSSTYKEPQVLKEDDSEDLTSYGGLQPASALASEKTYNPQIALKHYKYHPHPLPVLPGPSVMDEANENELFREASKLKRSQSKIDTISQSTSKLNLSSLASEPSATNLVTDLENPDNLIPLSSVRQVNIQKPSRGSISRKKTSSLSVERKKENASKQTINVCLVKTDIPESFVAAQTSGPETVGYAETSTGILSKTEMKNLKRENTIMTAECSNPFKGISNVTKSSGLDGSKELVNRSVQCTIFGCPDKTFVLPSAIKTLLKMLAFILHEINKDEVLCCTSSESKRIMTQVQLILGDLCNQNAEKDFGFDVTYSDSKRVEKLLEDLHRYLKNVYGTNGDLADFTEEIKNLFLQLKLKELELGVLNDEIEEGDSLRMTEVEIKPSDMKNPEVTLQNKRLESEQLLAEVEFSRREILKFQKALAEADWDIKTVQDRMMSMKKSSDFLGRKPSIQKFSTEASRRGTRGKDSEDSSKSKRKT